MPRLWLRPALTLATFLLSGSLTAQVQIDSNVTLSADFAFRYQFYRLGGVGVSRYPTHLPRFDAHGEFRFGDKFSLPFAVRIARALPSPLIVNPTGPQTIGQYLLHPGNMLYVGPKWKNFQLHLGSQTPYFSELSIGDLQLFGLGATYQMGTYRFFGVIGIGQRGIEPTGVFTGAFRRDLAAFRVERKLLDKHIVGLNVVKAKDRIASVDSIYPLLLPQKGVIISVNGNFKVNNELTLHAELANAAFANDLRLDSANSEFSPAGLLIAKSHTSSFALTAGARYVKKGNGFNAHVKRIGKEFNHVAYPQRDNDVLDISFSPYGQLLNNKVSMNGQIGFMSNSVSQMDSSLFGNQVFGMVNTNIRPARMLDIQFGYFRSHLSADNPVDSLKYKAIVQNLQVAPTFKKKLFGINHRLTLLFSMNSSITTESPAPFLLGSVIMNKQVSYNTDLKGIMLNASYSILSRKGGVTPLTKGGTTNTLALGARGRFKQNQVQPFLNLTIAGTKLTTVSPPLVFGRKFYIRTGCTYRFTDKTSGEIVIANDHFRYGATGGPVKNEFILQLELKHRL